MKNRTEYREDIARYSKIIETPGASLYDYGMLYDAYRGLRKHIEPSEQEAFNEFLKKYIEFLKKSTEQGDDESKAQAYFKLAGIYFYKNDNQRGLAYLDIAVEFDKRFLIERGLQKLSIYKDKRAAMNDFQLATELLTDPSKLQEARLLLQRYSLPDYTPRKTFKEICKAFFEIIFWIFSLLVLLAYGYYKFFYN